MPAKQSSDPLDTFINAPYTGNGFSPELEQQYKQQQLNNLQKQINRKDTLNENDINKMQEIQGEKEGFIGEKLAMSANINSEPTNTEVLEAIDVLKRSGLNITAENMSSETTDGTTATTSNSIDPSVFRPSQEMQQLNMMLGNGNNNNDPMMNMLPFMMNANNNGQKIDPQVIQSMMTSSMLNSLNSMNTNDNK